ncbi:thioredoxin family protein [Cohnella panacarvi]|uniref:thioredoxin family protein n=1 Tax=Cohnella panacarvi TaxID=400776 RepID=UPI00047B23B9|nr:thioredoxin family protein [Cohnella panacarvi]
MLEWENGDWERAWTDEPGPLAVFVHTPLCGTCALAKRMLAVVEQIRPDFRLYAANLNAMPGIAQTFRIESVPCLLVKGKDGGWAKQYRFPSVTDIVDSLDQAYRGETLL